MKRRFNGVLLFLLPLLSAQAYSQDSGDRDEPAVADVEVQFLFINMLEFLGEFATEEGDWISPDILNNDAFVDLDGPGNVTAQPANDAGERRTRSVDQDEN